MQKTIQPGSKVLVTGATGYTGRVLTQKLLKQGLKVHAIARQSSNLQPLAGLDISWFRGDVFDEETVHAAMQGVEYVFHVAAAFREPQSTEQDYRNVHLLSTQLIVQEAQKNPDFKRLVHVSTMGVHGHIADPPGSEESAFSPGDGYQRTKVEAEKWLAEFAAPQGFPYTIIRPCAIYGPGERRLLKLFKMAAGPVFPILGRGKCWYHLVHVEDLTNAIILAATAETALGQAFIIGATEPIQLEEMATIIAREYQSTPRIIRLPIGPFFLLADICEAVCKPFKIEPPIYRRRVAFYSKDRHFSTQKMQEVLGYQPLWNNHDGIVESARWYKENHWL
ncbi:MAG: oxidoreductase [Deltaproteobacteria bacterium]|nr:MAG: oxidoreductase [Deltaproteobacteria bacterium]PIE72955.1 MAG: oxidoreductase [Deltaproteobacteria bacterium]